MAAPASTAGGQGRPDRSISPPLSISWKANRPTGQRLCRRRVPWPTAFESGRNRRHNRVNCLEIECSNDGEADRPTSDDKRDIISVEARFLNRVGTNSHGLGERGI